MRKLLIFGILLIAAAIVLGCTGQKTETNNTQIANPASVYCENQGYTLEIRTDANGGQAGYCIFGNGSECDEWAYYRGECSPSVTMPAVEPGTEFKFVQDDAAGLMNTTFYANVTLPLDKEEAYIVFLKAYESEFEKDYAATSVKMEYINQTDFGWFLEEGGPVSMCATKIKDAIVTRMCI